ncbi:MAG: hypothetical protein HZB26_08350 [Candidatus Hydrogenedentes bacterium]|nr:hypothetical protein [Candidatus Hydrogenedentota bacterium]
MSSATTVSGPPKRIGSVDQLRGYAIFGMLLVNAKGLFLEPVKSTLEGSSARGIFEAFLYQISHHRATFTYADTIAPLFVFVVGMGMRLSWLRRSEGIGEWDSRKSLVKRYTLLVLIAFALYAGWLWDALMDIGLAGLLAVMLIDKRPRTRIVAAFVFVLAYQCIHMFTSYGVWSVEGKFSLADPKYVPLLVKLVPLSDELFKTSLNGGPLGPLSWVMMLLFGSYAYDVMRERNDRKLIVTCLGWGVGLCAVAYALHVEWPGVKAAWPFSARYMTAPFPLWSTGLCFFQLLAFHLICDKLHLRVPTFTSVGMNPLLIYIAQSLFLDVAESFAPERLSLIAGLFGFAIFWSVFAGAAYYMHRKRIYVKL